MAIRVAIEGYDSLEQIEIGGMAAVYRARKVSIDKTVAIKVLFPYLATDESYIDRFQREAKAAASIQHENIVNVIDFGESEGSFYIVMEYYDGRTLEQLLDERPGLPPDVALQILLEVAYGLEAAHACDIVHRDIKPANVIFTNAGGIKIADFGLARKSDSMTLTQEGKVIGTPAYMSPEQAAGRPVGPQSDIFSLGVVAYELLSRKKPFDGKTYSEVLEKIQTLEPVPVAGVNPLIAPELEAIVGRALTKNERDRYASATELIADLEAAMDKNQIARDRRRLATYAKDPEQYDAAFAEKTITQCLSRGAFFMQKGHTHLDDAVLEYRRILFLDPNNERARKFLSKLRNERGDEHRTVTLDAAPVNGVATSAGVSARDAARREASAKSRKRRYGVAAAAVVTVLAAAVWLVPRSRVAGDAAKQTAFRPDKADSTPVERAGNVTGGADSSLMSAAAGEAGGTLPVDAPAAKGHRANSRETIDTHAKSPATGKRNANAADTGQLASNLSNDHREPAPAKAAPVKEATPAPGLLSVYFLGAVGELWVDGKQFGRQPPFEKASISAGVHQLACRMSSDQIIQEVMVTIRPGHETVVEYEVGGKPVVTDE